MNLPGARVHVPANPAPTMAMLRTRPSPPAVLLLASGACLRNRYPCPRPPSSSRPSAVQAPTCLVAMAGVGEGTGEAPAAEKRDFVRAPREDTPPRVHHAGPAALVADILPPGSGDRSARATKQVVLVLLTPSLKYRTLNKSF